MAQLKDLLVTGASRLIGDIFTNKIQITTINAPTASNGTTYGHGSSGQVLMSNGTSTYWGGLTAENLGLSNAMHFIGVATVAITDGSTTDPAISGYSTKTAGDVIIDKDTAYEYVWTKAGKWERLGPDGSYKVTQTAYTDSTGTSESTTATRFVYSVSQNANGVVSFKTRPLPTSFPASDVSSWAKAANKPTYTFSELTSKPTTLAGYGIIDANISDEGAIQLGTDTIVPLTSHQEVSNSDATLAWDTPTTIATIGETEIKVSLPSNPNTNNAVTQTPTATNADYRVLFSNSANDNTVTETARKNTNFKFNPSTGNLSVTKINGVTVGTSPKFTDTTYTSKTAASGGTDVSLVTTGEKYTWNSKTSNTGTVTSVQVTATGPIVSSTNTAQTETLSTTISLSDAYGDTKNPFGSKTANYVLAAPNGSAGAPTFRKLVANDIPSLAASKISRGTFEVARIPTISITDKTSGTLTVERGGTGVTAIANIQAGKDGDGNTISDTYLKLAGGTMTGSINPSGSISLGTSSAKWNNIYGTNVYATTFTGAMSKSITIGDKSYDGSDNVVIDLTDLHLSTSMEFKGIVTNTLTDGASTPTSLTLKNGGTLTVSSTTGEGYVVIDATGKEYIWSGNPKTWNNLGVATDFALSEHVHGNIKNNGAIGTISGYAVYTTTGGLVTAGSLATSDPSASSTTSTTFIDTISQNSKGKITATKKTLPTASTSVAGIIKIGTTANDAAAGNHSHTITANATDGYWDLTGTNGTNAVTYALAPYSSRPSNAGFYTGTTAPNGTTRLNYNGYLYATKLYSGGTAVLTSHQTVINNNINLTWNTETTIATIGSTAIKVKLPVSPGIEIVRLA